MGDISGTRGVVKLGTSNGVTIAGIDNWNLTIGARKDETTAYGDSAEEFLQTVKFWNGSFTGMFQTNDTQQFAIIDQFETSGTLGSFKIKLFATSILHFDGSIIVDEINITGNVKESKKFGANFTGTGNFTRTTTS